MSRWLAVWFVIGALSLQEPPLEAALLLGSRPHAMLKGMRDDPQVEGQGVPDLDAYLGFPESDEELFERDELQETAVLLQHKYPAILQETADGGSGKTVACPEWNTTVSDLHRISARRGSGAVRLRASEHKSDALVTLFLLAPPYSASTALFSLITSSPNVATLCSGGTWACEGARILQHKGVLKGAAFWDPDQPDWKKALNVFEKYWDPRKQIRVEKSPPNINKIPALVKFYKDKPTEVAFVTMSTSICFNGRDDRVDAHAADVNRFSKDLALLKASGLRHLHLHREDLLRDPYEVSERLLAFLPALQELDPDVNNLSSLSNRKDSSPDHNDRAGSIVGYILSNGPFGNKAIEVAAQQIEVDQRFGYAA